MKHKIILAGVLIAFTIVLLGCTQPPGTNQTFNFGETFTAKENVTYVSSDGIHLRATNFTDSRCPTGVQCIWAGEVGVDVAVYLNGDPALRLGNIHLGETTARIVQTNKVSEYKIQVELVSIDYEKKEVQIIVTKISGDTNNTKEWFSIDPKQCNSNAWSSFGDELRATLNMPLYDKDVVRLWLEQKQGIFIYDSSSKQVFDTVCLACSCPTGERIAVLVDASNSAKMIELGFATMGAIACTMDAKVCPDGSAVGRTAPFCEFEKCP